ncbi:MAG TPA: ribosome-associated translation inhibitor RaiA [Aliidongia sp.]|nr:ribosome-associated translation inhibitor RaiA [Aliidongia sp.]
MAMQLRVTGKQMDVGDALRAHIEGSLSTLVGKYFGHGIEAHAVISREAHRYTCDLQVHVGRGILMQSSEKDSDVYQAADRATERIAKRMRRYKRRLNDHNVNGKDRVDQAIEARSYILAAEPEDHEDTASEHLDGQPVVVAEMAAEIPTLTVGEAVMRMDLAELPTLMFRNSAHGGLNVVYRRNDGHIGWIDPRQNGSAAPAE